MVLTWVSIKKFTAYFFFYFSFPKYACYVSFICCPLEILVESFVLFLAIHLKNFEFSLYLLVSSADIIISSISIIVVVVVLVVSSLLVVVVVVSVFIFAAAVAATVVVVVDVVCGGGGFFYFLFSLFYLPCMYNFKPIINRLRGLVII